MKMEINVEVNGTLHEKRIEAATPLVDFLRHELGLTGAHVGCRSASCGACTVLMDGRTVKSCCVLAAETDGSVIQTVENGEERGPDTVQKSFVDCQAMQCGFCTPGMVVSVRALLEATPNPSHEQAERAIAGNLCRCTGYANIFRAIETAAERSQESADSQPVR